MSQKLELTLEAREDLSEIWKFIAQDNEAIATQFLNKLYTTCIHISDIGVVGRSRPELGKNVLSYSFKQYVIFFIRTKNKLTVLRILHGARDHSKVFDK